MTRYEFLCPQGPHRLVEPHPMGQAPESVTCMLHQTIARRVFSVPVLITTYPMSLSEAEEQVTRQHEEAERNWQRPSHDVLMERVGETVRDRERGGERWHGGEI